MSLLSFSAESTLGSITTFSVRNPQGAEIAVVLYKRAWNPKGPIERPTIELVDTFNGEDPSKSSIRRPSQLFDHKPGTDVILLGHAHPDGEGATEVDVSLRVGPIHKVIRAHGVRAWTYGAFGGLIPGPALAIREPVPLIYELAHGGADDRTPEKPLADPRNHVGRGVSSRPKELVGTPAAQLEYARGGGKAPAAFNPIHRHWQPRAAFAGTYNQEWMDSRMPLLPEDFDDRYHVCVPEDQWSRVPLRSDVPIEIENATADRVWRIELPRITPGFSSVIGGKRQELRTHLDTILVDADARVVELTWRASFRMPRKYEMVDRVIVVEKALV